MLAWKRHWQMLQSTGLGVQAHAGVRSEIRIRAEAAGELNVLVDHAQIRSNFTGDIAEYLFHIGWWIKHQGGHTLLENTGFFAGNKR